MSTAREPAFPDPALVIFDCDGVLVDSEPLFVELELVKLAELGWPMTADELVDRFVGKTAADMAADVEAHLGHPLPAGWAADLEAEQRAVAEERLEPVAMVSDAIHALLAHGASVCVASSGAHDKIRHSLTKTGLLAPFEGRIFSAQDVANGKPAPDLFLHAAATLDFAPSTCVVVEDSQHGVAAANAAAMRSIGYAGSVTPAAWLRDADVVIDDMADLVAQVEALLAD